MKTTNAEQYTRPNGVITKEQASKEMKELLKQKGYSYKELAYALSNAGLRETVPSITCKINRGTFPHHWFRTVENLPRKS